MGGYRLSFSPSDFMPAKRRSHPNAERCHRDSQRLSRRPVPMRRRMAAPRSSHVERALTETEVLRPHTPIAHGALTRTP